MRNSTPVGELANLEMVPPETVAKEKADDIFSWQNAS